MLELCIDSSEASRVAVVRDGRVLARAEDPGARHHAESLAPLVQRACREAGLPLPLRSAGIGRVLVGTGPAPFTGLRAGLVTARALGRALGVAVLGSPSLDLVARGALDGAARGAQVLAVADARRHEVYWARYRAAGRDGLERLAGPRVGAPADLEREPAAWSERPGLRIVGAGARLHRGALEPLASRRGASVDPGAFGADPALLARIVAWRLACGDTSALGTEPLYLRRPDVQGAPGAATRP